MGAWAVGPFDNDAAQDWLLTADAGDGAVAAALANVGSDGWLDVDEGSAAVAAAAVVAAACDGDTAALPAEAAKLARGLRVDDELRRLTIAAMERVGGEESELCALWAESDAAANWGAILDAIVTRVRD
jgi:hypothetical protein